MAIKLTPYSQTASGQVTDIEHERLWSGFPDGLLAQEPSTALEVSFTSTTWSCQPGRILIAGHVLDIDTIQSGSLPAAAASTRTCVVCAYVEHSTSPWEYGIELVIGTPGSGRPENQLTKSLTGRYRVPLRMCEILSSGTVLTKFDERPRVRNGALVLPGSGSQKLPLKVENAANQPTSSPAWQNGTPTVEGTFIAPPNGKVKITVYGRVTVAASETGTGSVSFALREDDSGGNVIVDHDLDQGPNIRALQGNGDVATLITGLTPYRPYFVRLAHQSSILGQEVVIAHRRFLVEPIGD